MQLAESMINKGINIIDRRKVAFAVILDWKEKEKHEVRLLPGQMSVLVVQYKGDRTTTYSLTNGENWFSELTKKILSDLRYIKAEDTVK